MKYMLQVRFNGADAVIGGLPIDEQEKVTAEFEAIRESKGVLDGNQLQAASAAASSCPGVQVGPTVEAYRPCRTNSDDMYDRHDRGAARP